MTTLFYIEVVNTKIPTMTSSDFPPLEPTGRPGWLADQQYHDALRRGVA